MHRYYEDRFDAIETGVRFATHARMTIDDGGGGTSGPTPTTTLHTRTVTVDGKDKSLPVTPTDQVKESIKDGVISAKEKTTFEKSPAASAIVVKDEQKRLTEAVRAANGDDLARDKNGRVEIKDGKPVPTITAAPTEHEKRVAELAATKDSAALDVLEKDIKEREAAGATLGLDVLKQDLSERRTAEAKVVEVVKDKLALQGTLEAEKLSISTTGSTDAENDFQKLKEFAQPAIERFNANGGQMYEGNDWFGDDWDESKVTFDSLAKVFSEDPDKLKEFALVQGVHDGDLKGKSQEELNDYMAGLDSDEQRRIAMRHGAATELTTVFQRYNNARNSNDSAEGRAAALDAEIKYLDESIVEDVSALSKENVDQLVKHVTPIAGILVDPAAPIDAADTKASTNSNAGAPDTEPKDKAGPKTVDIDYRVAENQSQVIAQAQAQNLLPEANVAFNDKGEAVYTVQPGDSYWRIADRSDGKPGNEFDAQHFTQLVNTNSQRLGRDPQVGLIHADEQVIIQDRSLDQLVALLNLPTTKQVDETSR